MAKSITLDKLSRFWDNAKDQLAGIYIKDLSVIGRTVTYTRGDGTTGTITTQDTNTTYSPATASANGLMTAAHYSKVAAMPVITVSETEPTSPATGDLWAW